MELKEILNACRKLAVFLSKYSLGNIKEQSELLIRKIDKYIEEEELYS